MVGHTKVGWGKVGHALVGWGGSCSGTVGGVGWVMQWCGVSGSCRRDGSWKGGWGDLIK